MATVYFKAYTSENPYHEAFDPLNPQAERKNSPAGRDYFGRGDKHMNDWMLDGDTFINKLIDHPEISKNKELLEIICDLATENLVRGLWIPYMKYFQTVIWDNRKDDKKGSFCYVLGELDEYGITKLKDYEDRDSFNPPEELKNSGSTSGHDAAADITGVNDDIPF